MRKKGSASDEDDDNEITVLRSLKDPQTVSTKPNERGDIEAQETNDDDFPKYPIPEKMSCADKILYLLCCHGCGSTCCRRRTKTRRCAKKFFKTFAVG